MIDKLLSMKFGWKKIAGCRDRSTLLTRWFIFKSENFNIYLHKFHRSDEDRELHDHPWNFLSIILWGGYYEHNPKGPKYKRRKRPGMILWRPARSIHKVELIDGKPSYSLVIVSKKVREWGFHCEDGWKPWHVFHGLKGCGDE